MTPAPTPALPAEALVQGHSLTGGATPRRLTADSPCPSDGWPLLNSAAAQRLEQNEAAQLPPHTLMQRAGLAVARLALALAPHAQRIWIVAGRGNNGGDGFEAAVHLHQAGRKVQVDALDSPSPLPPDAQASLDKALAAGIPVRWVNTWTAPPDTELVIDALLGRGLTQVARGPAREAIAAMRACTAPILAVDLPSGLPADTGCCPDPEGVVEATWTLALLSLSPGTFTGDGRSQCGALWWDDLGVTPPTTDIAAHWAGASVWAPHRPTSPHRLHKGSRGDVWVVGGAPGMTGAVWLAARRALHCGAGRVYVHPLAPNLAQGHNDQPELMVRPDWDPSALTQATVVAGCGGGQLIETRLPDLLEHAPRLVLDADALNALARRPDRGQTALRKRRERGAGTVLTPHPLEAARLLGWDVAEVQADRLRTARSLADLTGTVVVLKGSGTVIARPGASPWINPTGNAALATPGSGDVLAGWIGALWSRLTTQGARSSTPGTPTTSAEDETTWAVGMAVFDHGACAEHLRPSGEVLPAGELACARLPT